MKQRVSPRLALCALCALGSTSLFWACSENKTNGSEEVIQDEASSSSSALEDVNGTPEAELEISSSSMVEDRSSSSSVEISSSSSSSSERSSSSMSSSSIAQTDVVYGPEVEYGGETYPTVVIGAQTWFARNLNIDPSTISGWNAATNSWCYNDDEANCAIYGRLYDWATAMGLESKYNSECSYDADCTIKSPATPQQGICPAGWHVPSREEWFELADAVGGLETAGKQLKSALAPEAGGWYDYNRNKDSYGFSALSGGVYASEDGFIYATHFAYWWSSTATSDAVAARSLYIDYTKDYMETDGLYRTYAASIRCVQDESSEP
jgi:uncharacterized protein (TIGR02145 family)